MIRVQVRGIALAAMLLAGVVAPLPAQRDFEREVFYHIFVRSFQDSNSDRNGDLRGIEDRLGYLQDLGVTSLLLTPINPSPFYHNYFGSSFEGVDSAYGGIAAYTRLVEAVHRRKMRLYLDQEIQYVVNDHPWWKESAGKPESRFSKYLIYHGPGNTDPESGPFGIVTAPMWNGDTVTLTTLNLREPAVIDYFAKLFADLVDPNHDGRFDDGVDGFRIDHMMDTLDAKKDLPGLFQRFWAPVFARARAVNPRIKFIAEQADWGYGEDFLTRGRADVAFAFPIRFAIVGMDRAKLAEAISETARRTPAGKDQLLFIENHDTDRFASAVASDPAKLRLGAALNILLQGTPLIYYGQEIGMRGRQSKEWKTDANDIPVREAMEWHAENGSTGDAEWYRESGPWWTGRYARDTDSVSVEEQQGKPGSLLSYYRRLLTLRRARPELQLGDQRLLATDSPKVLALLRSTQAQSTLLLANLGETATTVTIPRDSLPATFPRAPHDLLALGAQPPTGGNLRINLAPYEIKLLGR